MHKESYSRWYEKNLILGITFFEFDFVSSYLISPFHKSQEKKAVASWTENPAPAPFDQATTVLTQENWCHLELIQRQTLEYKKIKVLACSKDSARKPVKHVSFWKIQESTDTDIFPSLQEGLRALVLFIFKACVWMYKCMKVRLLRLI